MARPTPVFTLGHSSHPLERLVQLLSRQAIGTLVDVRSHPYSRWAPQYAKHSLSRGLVAAGVEYVYLGRELGGRPEGGVDYRERALAADFLAGIEQLVALARRVPVAILCAEEDPSCCHRRQLVTPALLQRGLDVHHIRGDGRVQTEAELESGEQLGLFR